MNTQGFHWITLATALLAALGAASSLAIEAASACAGPVAGPAANCPLIALPTTATQLTPTS